jgi:hypothetical protein
MLPLVIVFQKKLGYSIIKKERKERKEKKKKRTNVPLRNKKRDLASPSSPQILQVF